VSHTDTFFTAVDWGTRALILLVSYRYYSGCRPTYYDPGEDPELQIRRVLGRLGPSPDRLMNMVDMPDGEVDMGLITDEAWEHARGER